MESASYLSIVLFIRTHCRLYVFADCEAKLTKETCNKKDLLIITPAGPFVASTNLLEVCEVIENEFVDKLTNNF